MIYNPMFYRSKLFVMLARIFTRRSSTLVDSFGRHHNYLRISLTEKCTYCMPEEGVPLSPKNDILTNDEIIKLVTLFREEGVNKIRLTGGEPTLRKDLVQLVKDINSVGGIESIGITTNGIVFNRYAEDLVKAGLTHVNISLDTLDPNKYAILSRRNGFEKVIKNIEFSRSLFKTVKINNVVMRGINDNEVVDFVRMTRDKNLDVRFIEWMPFGGNNFNSKKMVSYKELLAKIDGEIAPHNIIKINDSPNDTSKGYKIQGWTGSFGFISSMTDNFCGTCNRMRLTANGHLKVCLHDNAEVSLKDMLRNNSSDDQIKETISNAVNAKKFKHAGMENLKLMKNRPMILIARSYSTKLSHVDTSGKISMVDTSSKESSTRIALAQAIIHVSPKIMTAVLENSLKKGDVESIAKIAGINAVKQTSNLIPLCHNIPINHVKIDIIKKDTHILILSRVKTTSNTGVEMEALAGASITALTIYDMCKALGHDMEIGSIKLLGKTGGKTDFGIINLK